MEQHNTVHGDDIVVHTFVREEHGCAQKTQQRNLLAAGEHSVSAFFLHAHDKNAPAPPPKLLLLRAVQK